MPSEGCKNFFEKNTQIGNFFLTLSHLSVLCEWQTPQGGSHGNTKAEFVAIIGGTAAYIALAWKTQLPGLPCRIAAFFAKLTKEAVVNYSLTTPLAKKLSTEGVDAPCFWFEKIIFS